ncbi:MAG: enoyl-CoA hydratase-related protein [Pseudomonadota bacterium]
MTAFPDSNALDLEFDRGWLTVWFNEPAIRNPLTAERAGALLALCAHLQDRPDVRGVTFRGRGGVFCAGGDLRAFGRIFGGGEDPLEAVLRLSREAGALFDAVDALPQPTVMAVEGAALAGGFGLACLGDVVIAEESAKFALTEVRIGLTPAQIAPFVARRIGPARARRLMLLGETLRGVEAAAAGLVDELVTGAAGVDAALARIRAHALGCAPGAVAETKALLRAPRGASREQEIEAAARSFAGALLSEEGREGVAAFVQKRKPAWAEDPKE